MIGFIGPIFRRMSEVNSTAITAQLVFPTARSAAPGQRGARAELTRPGEPALGARLILQ